MGVAKTIEEIANDEKTIVYCAYATECEKLNLAMSTLGLKCASYTGNQTSAADKVIIYENMKAGEIDILIAYGCKLTRRKTHHSRWTTRKLVNLGFKNSAELEEMDIKLLLF